MYHNIASLRTSPVNIMTVGEKLQAAINLMWRKLHKTPPAPDWTEVFTGCSAESGMTEMVLLVPSVSR